MADHNISIDIKANGAETTVKVLKEIRDDVNALNRADVTINFRVNTSGVTRAINALKGDLNEIAGANAEVMAGFAELISSGFQGVLDAMDKVNNTTVAPKVDMSGVEDGISKAERFANALDTIASGFNFAASVSSGIGDFAGGIASAVGGMSDMFNFDALGTAKRYLTAMATRAITGQIGGIIERYDIMNTFEDYMAVAGVSSEVAKESLNAVDQSIRGIPIGLDEAAFRLRKYQMYLNDIDLATDFTIGIQKAITAGGASEQMKTTAYTQIDRLLATGKLGQSRQWLSLFNGLGVSLRFLKEELGLDANADLKSVAAELASGSIPVEDFINAVARLANNEGLDQTLSIYKGTIEAWQANINNAVKRAGQNIMENVNGVMEDTLGFGITGVMKRIRDGIDTASKEAGSYIRDNPQHVKTIGDAIDGLIGRVMELDGGRFVDNVVRNIGGIANVIGQIIGSFPPGFLEDFTAFATTWAGPLATVMTAAQSGLGAVFGVFERLNKMDMSRLISQITREIERMAKIVSRLLDLIPDGLLGDLMAFGLVWGKPLAKVLSTIATAFNAISTSIKSVAAGNAVTLLDKLIALFGGGAAGFAGLATAVGLFTGLAAAIGMAYSAHQDWKQSVIDDSGLGAISQDIENIETQTENLKKSYENAQKSFADEMAVIRSTAEESAELLAIILDTDEKIREADSTSAEHDELVRQQIENLEKLKALQPDMILNLDAHGRLEDAAALRELGDAYIELVQKQAEAKAMEEELINAYDTKNTAKAARDRAQKDYDAAATLWRQSERTIEALEGKVEPDYAIDNRGLDEFRRTQQEQEQYEAALLQQQEALENMDRANAQILENDALIAQADATINSVSEGIVNTENAISDLADQEGMENVSKDIQGASDATAQLDDRLQKVVDRYNEAKEAAQGWIDTALAGYEELERVGPETDENGNPTQTEDEWLSGTFGGALGGQKSQNLEAGRVNAALSTIESWYTGLAPEVRKQFAPMVDEIVQSSWDDRALILAFADRIENADWDSILDLANEQLEEAGLKSNISETIGRIIAAGDENYDEAVKENPTLFDLVEKTVQSLEGLNTFDLSGFIQNVGKAADGMEPMQDSMGQIKGSADAAADSINRTKGSIDNVARTASGKSGEMGTFAGSLSLVTGAAYAADAAVSALAASIASLHNKDITIRVNMVGRIGAGGGAVGPQWGGLIGYYAMGGHPGFPKGTDIIPAWLTPGEFVMRRASVGLFGSKFMERVNKMDIGGAFDALMMRISNPMGHGATYNRDNHATVNNYFMGDNGQNYSQRKAYRFAGSL